MIERLAYAKINLFLDVEGIRDDGYHNILSVMQTVSWADKITIQQCEEPGIRLFCTEKSIPTDNANTAYRAAELFLSYAEIPMGLQIHIEKHIPSSAGLAGGSSDAAAVLLGLNKMTGSPFSSEQLLELGAKIGADVPFCMVGGTQTTTGIGNVMEPFPSMPRCYLICAKKGDGVSTPAAYRAIDEQNDFFRAPDVQYNKLNCLQNGFALGDLSCVKDGIFNIFEKKIEKTHPDVSLLKKALLDSGAIAAMMSGSGPSVFGIFADEKKAELARDTLQNLGATCAVCTPVARFEG